MSITVKELAFVFHPVTDVARARKFYEQVLGLTIGLQIEFQPGQWWVEYDIAGQALAISNVPPPNSKPQSSVYLEVADLDVAVASARAGGATIVHEIMDFPPCRMSVIADPDGNQIGLHQRKTQA